MDVQKLIDLHYGKNEPLRHVLLTHSEAVAQRCVRIIEQHSELQIDAQFVKEAAMLHDIGICFCNAPSIHCHGTHPYICHGHLGAELLREYGYDRHARVCERHTGAGLTKEEIIRQQLPLPADDFLPETLEEKLICYADKFYSKTRLGDEKTLEQAVHSLEKFGSEGVARFLEWHKIFN